MQQVMGGVMWAGSPPLLAVDGEGQRDVERVVVLDQRGVLVVQNQLLQRPVQVVGLGEAEAGARLVDDAVLHLAVHPEGDTETQVRRTGLRFRTENMKLNKSCRVEVIYRLNS